MNLEQAREVIDIILRQIHMSRDDHAVAGQALGLLYSEAKENEELRQTPKLVQIPTMKESPCE